MAKAPAPGRAKTRLARTLGSELAARLAAAFLRDTWELARLADGVEPVIALAGEPTGLPPGISSAAVLPQGGGDLGARMERQLRAGCELAGRCVLIGADSPGLPPALLDRAVEALDEHDAVLGPSEDGGFWTIGLRRCPPGRLLDGLPWSAPETFARTLERLRSRGLTVALAPTWFDVDEERDLARLALLLERGGLLAPATRAALPERLCAAPGAFEVASTSRPGVSVVIPAFDEAARLPRQLLDLAGQPGVGEVLVVDGGSLDGTRALAHAFPGVRLVDAPRGRARQLNAGAALAVGDVLLFLHADVALPKGAGGHIARALADPDVVGGAFLTHTVPDGGRWRLGPLLRLADGRSRYTQHPYGDQALFVRADVFRALGGYPDIPLMEDLELSRRLARRGRLARCRAEVRVSGRRFQARPVYYTTLVNVFPLLYRLGVSPARLARLYHDTR